MSLPAGAEEDLLAGEPGFVDLSSFEFFSRDQLDLHISVKGPLLSMVANMAEESDPELAAALGALKGVEVRVYSVGEEKRPRVDGLLENLAKHLRGDGWSTAMTIRVARDHGYAMLRFAGGDTKKPVGLVAMYLTEENEAVFVNIVGGIDTTTIGHLARRYDLDLLAVDGEPPS